MKQMLNPDIMWPSFFRHFVSHFTEKERSSCRKMEITFYFPEISRNNCADTNFP